MKKFNMKLMTKYFDCIQKGSKRIELRLNDKKRKNLKVGDEIVFEELTDHPRYIKTEVIELYYDSNFEDLINRFDVELLASKDTSKEDLVSTLNSIYSKEKQNQYGVVGIRIKVMDD